MAGLRMVVAIDPLDCHTSLTALGRVRDILQTCAFLPRRIPRNKCKESAPSRDIFRGKPVDAPDPHT